MPPKKISADQALKMPPKGLMTPKAQIRVDMGQSPPDTTSTPVPVDLDVDMVKLKEDQDVEEGQKGFMKRMASASKGGKKRTRKAKKGGKKTKKTRKH